MDISAILFFFTLFIYAASLVAAFMKRKFDGLFKKVLRIINWTALGLTLVFMLLWSFDIHLSSLRSEIIPFWTFLISAIILFGLTRMAKQEKLFYGFFFFGNLFLTVILLIPFVGFGIASMVYSPFLTDSILFEDSKLIVADETNGLLSMKPSPTIYLKNGLFSHKYKTNAYPVHSIDSVLLLDDKDKAHIIIYEGLTKTEIDIIK